MTHETFDRLARLYMDAVFRLAFSYLKNRSDAEDVTQTALLRLYQCHNAIFSLPWAVDFGEEEIRIAMDNADRVLEWYDDLREVVPNWYRI